MIEKALIVEDLPEARTWLESCLRAAFPGIAVDLAGTLASAREKVRSTGYGLALVDIGLPDGNGVQLIEEWNTQSPDTLCVVTSVFDDDQHLFSALRAGARGYMLKDQSREELVSMLTGIIAGHPPLSPAIARRLLDFFSPTKASPPEEVLTDREREVLALSAKGYTIARVAEILGITRNTGAGYVKVIYRKLNISSRAEATMEASRRGIISAVTD